MTAPDRADEVQRKVDGISERIREAISTGVKSVLVTEELLRSIVADFLPREISATVKTTLEGVKKELYSSVVNELNAFLSKIDVAGEVRKVLSGMKIRIQAEIEFEEPSRKSKKG